MEGKSHWQARFREERGLTLIEILIAVSIMGIISVTLMGYFLSAMEKSADESNRIIASNLARLKAAEIRNDLKATQPFNEFALWLNNSGLSGQNINLKAQIQHNQSNQAPFDRWIEPDTINGTQYHYTIRFASVQPQPPANGVTTQTREDFLGSLPSYALEKGPSAYEIRMIVQVHWSGSQAKPAKSTHVDTYIVNRGG